MYNDDFPNAEEMKTVSDEELLGYVRACGRGLRGEQEVQQELHRRHPDLDWITWLEAASYQADTDAAGGHPSPMRLQFAPASELTESLREAYWAAVQAILGEPGPLAQRPTISLGEWAKLAGVAERTLTGYCARGQAPRRIRFDQATGRPVWDRAVATAWIRFRPGRGNRDRVKKVRTSLYAADPQS